MLDHTGDTVSGQRPDIKDVLERFAADGKRWASAELRLASLEAREMKARTLRAAVAAGIGFAAAFCLLSALTQAGIVFMTPVFGSAGWAALVTAGLLALVIAICAWFIRNALRFEGESLLFRWFVARPQGLS